MFLFAEYSGLHGQRWLRDPQCEGRVVPADWAAAPARRAHLPRARTGGAAARGAEPTVPRRAGEGQDARVQALRHCRAQARHHQDRRYLWLSFLQNNISNHLVRWLL